MYLLQTYQMLSLAPVLGKTAERSTKPDIKLIGWLRDRFIKLTSKCKSTTVPPGPLRRSRCHKSLWQGDLTW